eukprot:SAG31_NODE_728_length_12522_cov_13.320534_3_plen_324_part_00
MYQAVVTAHKSSELEVKRMKKTVERAEQTMRSMQSENAALEQEIQVMKNCDSSPKDEKRKMILPRTASTRARQLEATSSAEADIDYLSEMPSAGANESRKSLYEKEILREKMCRRRRDDSIVLARQSSQSTVDSDISPKIREAWADDRHSPQGPHLSRRQPIESCTRQSSGMGETKDPAPKSLLRHNIDGQPRALTETQQRTLNLIKQDMSQFAENPDCAVLQETAAVTAPEVTVSKTQSICTDELDVHPAWEIPELAEARARIVGLTVNKLKEELKELGAIRTGKKQDLLLRLLEATRTNYLVRKPHSWPYVIGLIFVFLIM